MPRVNLSEEEAEHIRKLREVKTMQAVAYNQAIDDIYACIQRNNYTIPHESNAVEAWLVGLKREVPSK